MRGKPIEEVNGWILKDVKLTARGRKKVEDAYEWHFAGGYLRDAGEDPSTYEFWDRVDAEKIGEVEDWIFDIEFDALHGLQHPACRMKDEIINFVEGEDYVIEMQSEEAFDLELIAQRLNETHKTFEAELKRLGW